MKLLSLFFLVCSIMPVVARLGETPEQSIARYGSSQIGSNLSPAPDCELLMFDKDGMKIEAHFYKGICCKMVFQPDDSASVDALSLAAVKVLMAQNAQGSEWGAPDVVTSPDRIFWHRDDGGMAVSGIGKFSVESPDSSKWDDAVQAVLDTKAQQGAEKALKGM